MDLIYHAQYKNIEFWIISRSKGLYRNKDQKASMTPVEIIAVILAITILVKVIVILTYPKKRVEFAVGLVRHHRSALQLMYAVIALVTGYFILQSFSVVDVMAVVCFSVALMGITLIEYEKSLVMMIKESQSPDLLRRNWLSLIIWIALAVWTLYTVFF